MRDSTVLTLAEIEDECDSEILSTIDSFWIVERATLAALQGQQGQAKIRRRIDAALPSALQPATVSEVLVVLKVFKAGPLMKWRGAAALHDLDIVINALSDIREMHPKPIKLLASDYLKQVPDTIAWFCKHEKVEAKGNNI